MEFLNSYIAIILAGLLVFFAFCIFIYKRYRKQKRLLEQELERLKTKCNAID